MKKKTTFKKEALTFLFWMLFGVAFWFVCRGYRFTAFFFWGYAAIRACYKTLSWIISKKPKLGKFLKAAFTVCLSLALGAAMVTECFIISGAKGAKEPEHDYVLVLGAGVKGTVPSRSLSQRLHAAYDYLVKYPDAIAIVSGGQGPGEDITEAQCMYNWLTEKGIDPSRVWMEEKATSTEENLDFSLALIEEKTGVRPESLAILSSEYHLYRAGLMAGERGIDMLGVPAKTKPFPLRWHYYFREMFALWHYIVF